MSKVFSDTTLKSGIIQGIERECGFDDGTITGNSTLMAQFTADVNSAGDDATAIIIPAGGEWQYDDSNQTDYPIITTALVSGQRDYSFTTDNTGNLILDIYKVMCRSGVSGSYIDLDPIDQQSTERDTINDGNNSTGTPTRYDKTANGIFLDLIPNFSSSDGLKVFINRESTYFTVSDTTKKPGIAGLFHDYYVLKPSYKYARAKGLQNVERLERDVLKMEKDIKDYYSGRNKDVRTIATSKRINHR